MSVVRRVLVLSLLVLPALVYAQAQPQTQPAAPAASAAPDDVLAVVNGREIRRLDAELFRQQFFQNAAEQAAPDKRSLMRDLITLELLAQEGKKLGIDQDMAVQAQITMQTHSVLARAVVQKLMEDITISEEAMRQHYEQTREHYTVDETVTASHILVRTEKEAREVLQELQTGKDFADVARARSISPNASQGGSLGTFGRGRLLPAFEAAVFAMRKGEISGPVRTQFGFHIIKVADRIPAHTRSFDEVQDDLRKALMSQRIEAFVDELRQKADIRITDADYAAE